MRELVPHACPPTLLNVARPSKATCHLDYCTAMAKVITHARVAYDVVLHMHAFPPTTLSI